ncbi:hypothetical protein [Algoriphagus formosus]
MKSSLPSAGRHDVPVTRGDAPIYRGNMRPAYRRQGFHGTA